MRYYEMLAIIPNPTVQCRLVQMLDDAVPVSF